MAEKLIIVTVETPLQRRMAKKLAKLAGMTSREYLGSLIEREYRNLVGDVDPENVKIVVRKTLAVEVQQ